MNDNERELSVIFRLGSSSSFFFIILHQLLLLISQGQKWRRPTVQLGFSELPKENHSASFFLLHFLALASLRGDTFCCIRLFVSVYLCLSVPQTHLASHNTHSHFSSSVTSLPNYVYCTSDLTLTMCRVNKNKMVQFPK